MTRLLTHDQAVTYLGVYALDAVDGPEAEALELHLRDCPRCRAEVAEHRETAALLGYAGAPAPEGPWQRITAEMAGEAQRMPSMAPEPLPAPDQLRPLGAKDVRPSGQVGVQPPGPTLPGMARLPGRRGRGMDRRVVVAVAALMAVVVGGSGYELSHLQGQVSHLQAALNQTTANVVPTEVTHRLIDIAVTTPGHLQVDMRSATGGQVAEAVLLPDGQGYLVRDNLAPLPASQTYQLWALIGDHRVSVGLLGPRPDQSSFVVGAVSDLQMLMVTVEARGGVVQSQHPAVVWGPPVSSA